jgi:hypothetical protein
VCVCLFVQRKASGYASHLSGHRTEAEVVIIPPKMDSPVQPMDTRVTTSIKPIICARAVLHALEEAMG